MENDGRRKDGKKLLTTEVTERGRRELREKLLTAKDAKNGREARTENPA
jgi:hypothetical protein